MTREGIKTFCELHYADEKRTWLAKHPMAQQISLWLKAWLSDKIVG
jgi:hypothetical protein